MRSTANDWASVLHSRLEKASLSGGVSKTRRCFTWSVKRYGRFHQGLAPGAEQAADMARDRYRFTSARCANGWTGLLRKSETPRLAATTSPDPDLMSRGGRGQPAPRDNDDAYRAWRDYRLPFLDEKTSAGSMGTGGNTVAPRTAGSRTCWRNRVPTSGGAGVAVWPSNSFGFQSRFTSPRRLKAFARLARKSFDRVGGKLSWEPEWFSPESLLCQNRISWIRISWTSPYLPIIFTTPGDFASELNNPRWLPDIRSPPAHAYNGAARKVDRVQFRYCCTRYFRPR